MSTEEGGNPGMTVRFEGRDVPAEEVEFETEKEGWSIYVLSDGTRIKMKNIVTRVLRLVDRYKDDGDPLYLVQGAPVISSAVPENLKKKTEAAG